MFSIFNWLLKDVHKFTVQPSMLLFSLLDIQPPPDLAAIFLVNTTNNNNMRNLPASTAVLTPDENDEEEKEEKAAESAEPFPEAEINRPSSSIHEASVDDTSF